MDLLPLSLCLLTLSGSTSAAGNGPVTIKVKEGRDATLPCKINKDILSETFDWKKDGQKQVFLYEGSVLSGQDPQFTGRVSHSDAELMNGDASITIRKTKVVDSGVYTCNLPNLNQTFTVKLVVGTCSKPSITSPEHTGDSVPLQCEVSDASPGFKLNISWFNRSGTKLSETQIDVKEGGRSYILNTTVTKSDTYRCVATMEELSHQVYSEDYIYVPVSGPSVWPWVVAAVAVIAAVAVVVFLYCRKKRRMNHHHQRHHYIY